MFSDAVPRKLALEVFEEPSPGAEVAGLAAPPSGRRQWMAEIASRFNQLERVQCESQGEHDDGAAGPEMFLATINCNIMFKERFTRFEYSSGRLTRRSKRSLFIELLSGPKRRGLWLIECPSQGPEPAIAVPVIDLEHSLTR